MSTSLPHALSEIGQIAITVSDVAQATAFYRDVLGLRFLFFRRGPAWQLLRRRRRPG